MITGSKLSAPEGFRGLPKDVGYYFLASDGRANRARLVLFDEKGSSAQLITLSRPEFEYALINGDLIEGDAESTPPWLQSISGISVVHLEQRRVRPKESYDVKVNKRYLAIAELVVRAEEILASDNPEAIINAHAKDQTPVQNAGRLRVWFFTYLVFGRTKWSLMPNLSSIGKGTREQSVNGKVLGRPPKGGRNVAFPATTEMKSSILEGFIKYNDKSKTDSDIYGKILVRQFGCLTRKTSTGDVQFYHPEGKPFPTWGQYHYWLGIVISGSSYRKARKGPSGARAKAGFVGSFSDALINVNQLVEFDGYNPKDKISGVLEGAAVDAGCIVRGVCPLSGAVVALGFSENKENMEAYRMALFCTAVGGVKYASLFGLTISEEEWPAIGLPQNVVFDRGPGSTMDVPVRSAATPRDEVMSWLSRIELTPTHSGQSKASVESSHPRTKSNNDQPTHFHSSLNFVELCKRHILQVIYENKMSSASDRMIEEMKSIGFKPSPTNIFSYYDGVGRNSATKVAFEYAVREFLTPHPALIKRGGVFFYGRKYNSSKLVETGVFDRIANSGQIRVTAYVMVMCVRHIWVEIEGVLYELDFVRPASVHPDSVDISLSDLRTLDANLISSRTHQRDEQAALIQERNSRFTQATGKSWDSGVRKPGRPAKGGAAERDDADYKRLTGKGHD
jgi:hypothetical protein